MKKFFAWKNVLFIGIALCVVAALSFFSAFFTNDTAYYPISIGIFMWTGSIGSSLCALWTVPYIVKYMVDVVRYFRYGY